MNPDLKAKNYQLKVNPKKHVLWQSCLVRHKIKNLHCLVLDL